MKRRFLTDEELLALLDGTASQELEDEVRSNTDLQAQFAPWLAVEQALRNTTSPFPLPYDEELADHLSGLLDVDESARIETLAADSPTIRYRLRHLQRNEKTLPTKDSPLKKFLEFRRLPEAANRGASHSSGHGMTRLLQLGEESSDALGIVLTVSDTGEYHLKLDLFVDADSSVWHGSVVSVIQNGNACSPYSIYPGTSQFVALARPARRSVELIVTITADNGQQLVFDNVHFEV